MENNIKQQLKNGLKLPFLVLQFQSDNQLLHRFPRTTNHEALCEGFRFRVVKLKGDQPDENKDTPH